MAAGWNKGKKCPEWLKEKLRRERTGRPLSEETKRKMSSSLKGRTAWNKGIKAWNNGLKWPPEVKENISRGMIAYWIQRKESGGVLVLKRSGKQKQVKVTLENAV